MFTPINSAARSLSRMAIKALPIFVLTRLLARKVARTVNTMMRKYMSLSVLKMNPPRVGAAASMAFTPLVRLSA